MSMTTLTILQFITVFLAYSFVMLAIPAVVFRKVLKGRTISEQFLLCLMTGNFFVMNIVFVLQLLHISNKVTLILSTALIAIILGVKVNKVNIKELFIGFTKELKKVNDGKLGLRTLLYRMVCRIKGWLIEVCKYFYNVVVQKSIQWLWVFLVLGALAMIYAPQFINKYGYTASDVPVHMYWVNAMLENDIFVAGVYPFGYHCVVYYINQVFDVDVYVIMRVIAFLQNMFVTLALLGFLKACCKNKYVPYAMTFLYVASDFFNRNTYNRFYAPLPQEYGMMFILPAIYFGFKFFEARKVELAAEQKKKESLVALIGFAMSFGMTLTVHFYGTMAAGLFCVAMAIGYLLLFVRKGYFLNIVVTCIISVFIAVLPMGIAFATGTPLQGSLGWGLSIISGSRVEVNENPTESDITINIETMPGVQQGTENAIQPETESQTLPAETINGNESSSVSSVTEETTGAAVVEPIVEAKPKKSFKERIDAALKAIKQDLQVAVINYNYRDNYKIIYAAIVLTIILGVVFQILGRYCYGGMLLTSGIYMVIMSVLLSAGDFGLPTLMDASRCSIYYSYSVPVLFAFCIDGILNLLFWFPKLGVVKNIVSLAVSVGLCVSIFALDFVKEIRDLTTLETNEAVACLTNIIREEKDFSWTICSANDETQMGKEHGYHYETIDFLQEQEHVGAEGKIIIPTDVVYFFIEKRPLDYTISYANSGQSVSELGAMSSLPYKRGISMYQGEKRWILMSRMYYWAKEFQRMYPNEMTVYCETEDFICYRIEQNAYRLYNFAIDYGYNTN